MDADAESNHPPEPAGEVPAPVRKSARVVEDDDGTFTLEYPNSRGLVTPMRLDAATYSGAIREAKEFLEIQGDGRDGEGHLWMLEWADDS
jgi:hypothetical protein